jgi:hypothetical protein
MFVTTCVFFFFFVFGRLPPRSSSSASLVAPPPSRLQPPTLRSTSSAHRRKASAFPCREARRMELCCRNAAPGPPLLSHRSPPPSLSRTRATSSPPSPSSCGEGSAAVRKGRQGWRERGVFCAAGWCEGRGKVGRGERRRGEGGGGWGGGGGAESRWSSYRSSCEQTSSASHRTTERARSPRSRIKDLIGCVWKAAAGARTARCPKSGGEDGFKSLFFVARRVPRAPDGEEQFRPSTRVTGVLLAFYSQTR